jgi:chromosomal replication initiation ATPase DnaA
MTEQTRQGPPAEAFIQAVMQEYDVTRSKLIGPSKHHSVMSARRDLCIRLLCAPVRWIDGEPVYRSTTQIGAIVGGRDHSTVIYTLRQYASEMLGLPPKASVAEIRQAVQAGEMGRAA